MVVSDHQAFKNCYVWYLGEVPGKDKNPVTFYFTGDNNDSMKEVDFSVERLALDNLPV